MKTQIIIKCPKCGSERIVRNGKKSNGKQLYKCRDCNRQFIADHEKTYKGTIAWFVDAVKRALVHGCGIRDAAVILEVSIGKILAILVKSHYDIKPKLQHYACLEVDELWTSVHLPLANAPFGRRPSCRYALLALKLTGNGLFMPMTAMAEKLSPMFGATGVLKPLIGYAIN